MNVKYNKKGISLIALVLTIVITIILASVTIVSVGDIINDTKKSEFAKELYSIQNLVKQYNFKENKFPVNSQTVVDLSTLDSIGKEQFSTEPGYSTGSVTLYYIDLYEAGVENTTRGLKKNSDSTDVYLLSETTGKVYYLKGEKVSNNVYYTLNAELKSLVGLGK
jgi:type II secretory pathway pseudopilin PulG